MSSQKMLAFFAHCVCMADSRHGFHKPSACVSKERISSRLLSFLSYCLILTQLNVQYEAREEIVPNSNFYLFCSSPQFGFLKEHAPCFFGSKYNKGG